MAESAGDRLRVLKRVFDSVYTSSASDRDLDRVMELYAENAVFEDGITRVTDRKSIHAQFLGLRRMTKEMRVDHTGAATEGERPADAGGLQPDIAVHENVIVHYVFRPGIRIPLKQTTTLIFDKETGLIVRHIDSWYTRDTMKQMWGMSLLVRCMDEAYDLLRTGQGYLTSPLYLAIFSPTPALHQGRDAATARVWVSVAMITVFPLLVFWILKRLVM